jgi:hypothetical protein
MPAGQTFGDLPVVPIGRTRRRHFVVASQANQSITFFMPQWIALLAMTAG